MSFEKYWYQVNLFINAGEGYTVLCTYTKPFCTLCVGEHWCTSRHWASKYCWLSRNHPESTTPRTSIWGARWASMPATLSKLTNTPVPPALQSEMLYMNPGSSNTEKKENPAGSVLYSCKLFLFIHVTNLFQWRTEWASIVTLVLFILLLVLIVVVEDWDFFLWWSMLPARCKG